MSEIEKNFSSDPTVGGSSLRHVIHKCVDKLVYISETDAPIELLEVERGAADKKDLLKMFADINPGTAIEEVGFDKFFERLTTTRRWHGAHETAQVRGFQQLKQVLKDNLSDLHVYRVGTINIDILVVGRDREGQIVGIKTKAVET